jgi:hypothetical protein
MKRNGVKPVEKFFREFSLRKAFQSADEATLLLSRNWHADIDNISVSKNFVTRLL